MTESEMPSSGAGWGRAAKVAGLVCLAAAAVASTVAFFNSLRGGDEAMDLQQHAGTEPSPWVAPRWAEPVPAVPQPPRDPIAPNPGRENPPPGPAGYQRVAGVVLDGSGSAVAGATVILAPPSRLDTPVALGEMGYISSILDSVERGGESSWPSAVSSADGRFEMAKVLPGRHFVLASKKGFLRRVESLDVPASGDLEIRLERGLRVSGSLVDTEGTGVSGIEVAGFQRTRTGEIEFTASSRAVTGETGGWVLEGFEAGTVSVMPVLPQGADLVGIDFKLREASAGDAGIVFRVLRLATVEFTALLKTDGTPLGIPQMIAEIESGPADLPYSGLRVTPVDISKGRFALKTPPGRFSVRFHSPGLGSALAHYAAQAGCRTELPAPLLFGGGCSLSGRVAASGKAAAKAFVFLERTGPGDTVTAGTSTAADGAFAFYNLPEGAYRVVVLKKGFKALHAREDVAGGTAAEYSLEEGEGRSGVKPEEYAYDRRKKLRVHVEVQESTLEDFARWLGEISLVRFAAAGDLAASMREEGRTITLTMMDALLEHVILIVTRMQSIEFDEPTATFRSAGR